MLKEVDQFCKNWLVLHGLSYGRAKRILRNKGFTITEKDTIGWWAEDKDGKIARIFKNGIRKGYTIHYQI